MIDERLNTYPTFFDEIFRALPIWIVAVFQTMTQALPDLILWLTAIYGVLQIVRIVRVIKMEREKNVALNDKKPVSRKGKRSIDESLD